MTISGRQYTLRVSVDAVCVIEGQMGKGITAIVFEMQRGIISLTLIRAMLWAMLREHHPEVTLLEAGEMIPAAGGVESIKKAFERAFEAAFPDAPRQQGGPRPTKGGHLPRSGTGRRSTKRGARSAETQTPSGDELPAS